MTEPTDLSRLSSEVPIDDNMKVEGDMDAVEKELKIATDTKKLPGEGKKASVSLNLKRSPSPSAAPHSPSRPSSRKLQTCRVFKCRTVIMFTYITSDISIDQIY